MTVGRYCAVGVLSGLLANRAALLAHTRVVEGHRNETALFVVTITATGAALMIFCRCSRRLIWLLDVRPNAGGWDHCICARRLVMLLACAVVSSSTLTH